MSSPTLDETEERRKEWRLYYWRNRDKIREKRLASYDPVAEKVKNDANYAKNKDRILAYKRKHREENKEKYNDRARRKRAANPHIAREYHLRKTFGLTSKQYDAMEQKQGGVCAICGNRESRIRLSIDHCHKTGAVRALLCRRCNVAIGAFEDDESLLERALTYLRSFNAE